MAKNQQNNNNNMIPITRNGKVEFYICDHPVTQEEYRDVITNSCPSFFIGGTCPVEQVSFYDAVEYCNERSKKEGLNPYYNINKECNPWNVVPNYPFTDGYRLPTEKEWEYAAIGGNSPDNYIYSGDNIINNVAWYEANSNKTTHPVKQKNPNKLGLYDMSGNVWEWCWDKYYDNGGITNNDRIICGGSYDNPANLCEVASQRHFTIYKTSPYIGFRVARNAENSQDNNKENISKE